MAIGDRWDYRRPGETRGECLKLDTINNMPLLSILVLRDPEFRLIEL